MCTFYPILSQCFTSFEVNKVDVSLGRSSQPQIAGGHLLWKALLFSKKERLVLSRGNSNKIRLYCALLYEALLSHCMKDGWGIYHEKCPKRTSVKPDF